MLTEARLVKEIEVVDVHFPWFTPILTPSGYVGFIGHLRGPRSGVLFEVVTKILAQSYPEVEPPLYIEPKLTIEWWRLDDVNHHPGGRLCYHRQEDGSWRETPWQPAKNTFANVLGFAVQYIAEFDR